MHVLIVEPYKRPFVKEIGNDLSSMQRIVGGMIEAIYPYDDPVAIICNEEGKFQGLPLNRALRDENGKMYDIIAGTFFIAGLKGSDFISLSAKQADTFYNKFKYPESFLKRDGEIVAVPMNPVIKRHEPER